MRSKNAAIAQLVSDSINGEDARGRETHGRDKENRENLGVKD